MQVFVNEVFVETVAVCYRTCSRQSLQNNKPLVLRPSVTDSAASGRSGSVRARLLSSLAIFLLFANSQVYAAESDIDDADELRQTVEQTVLHVLVRIQSGEIAWPDCPMMEGVQRESPDTYGLLKRMAYADDPEVRAQAFAGLTEQGGEDTVRVLMYGLDDTESSVRQSALDALGKQDSALVADAVLARLADGTGPKGLAEGLRTLRPALESHMLDVLSDDSETPSRQIAAARALGAMESRAAAGLLEKRCWVRHEELALACADALTNTPGGEAFDGLKGLLRHPLPQVRMRALEGLARHGGPEAADAVYRVAMDGREPQLAVRRHAALMLGRINDPSAVHALMRLMERQGSLRLEAGASLRRLTGQPINATPLVWGNWYQAWLQNPVWPPPKPQGTGGPEVEAGAF